MVYLPLCCNWHCQRTLKLIETDLSLITEAAGVRKVDDRLVLSLSFSPSIPPSLPYAIFTLCCHSLSLALSAGYGGWQRGTAWRMATIARVSSDSANLMRCHGKLRAPPPSSPLILSLPLLLPPTEKAVRPDGFLMQTMARQNGFSPPAACFSICHWGRAAAGRLPVTACSEISQGGGAR